MLVCLHSQQHLRTCAQSVALRTTTFTSTAPYVPLLPATCSLPGTDGDVSALQPGAHVAHRRQLRRRDEHRGGEVIVENGGEGGGVSQELLGCKAQGCQEVCKGLQAGRQAGAGWMDGACEGVVGWSDDN